MEGDAGESNAGGAFGATMGRAKKRGIIRSTFFAPAITPPMLRPAVSPITWLSNAERVAVAGVVLLVLLYALPGAGALLEYQRPKLLIEPWRLLSGHLVHINAAHLLVNAVAWIAIARLFAPELGAHRQTLLVLVSSVLISLGLAALAPQLVWYRGMSGVLHSLFFAGAVAWLVSSARARSGARWPTLLWPAVLVAGGTVKLAIELLMSPAPAPSWLGAPVVSAAHALGAFVGAVVGGVAGWRSPAAGS